MNISDLREFMVLAETLSFSETAARTFISQSALSKHILRMERELDVPLFARNRQSVELTPAGRRLQDHGRYILRRYDMFLDEICGEAGQLSGTLRVGFLDAAVRNLLRTSIKTFSQRFPKLCIQPISRELGELERDLKEGKIDVAVTIRFSNSDWPKEYCFQELYTDGIAAVVGEDNPLAARDFLYFEELAGYPFLMPGADAYPDLGKLLASIAKARGVHLNAAYEFSNIQTASMMVESGSYVTAMPLHISKLFDRSRFIDLMDPEALIQIGAKWHMGCKAPGIRQFVGVLADSLGMI